jgi:hypothetical protein
MPQVTAIIWNLEVFGNYQAFREDDAVLDFVSLYAKNFNVDIILLQEVRLRGGGLAPSLVQLLNATTRPKVWHYDWLPGSIVTNTARGLLTNADLGFTQTGNNEGYMVLWAGDTLTAVPQAVSYGVDGMRNPGANDHYIGLVVEGANALENGLANPCITPVQPLAYVDACFPRPNPPDAGSGMGGRPSNALLWKDVRHPCFIRTGGTTTYIGAYHAPVSGHGPYYGALAAGLSRLVQDTATYPNVIFGGDFNIISDNEQASGFDNFLFRDPLGVRAANMTAGSLSAGDYAQSMVRFSVNNQGHALLNPANPADCYGNARDQSFYRLATAPTESIVHDLLEELMTDAAFRGDLQGAPGRSIGDFVRRAIRDQMLPGIVRGSAAVTNDLAAVFAVNSTAAFTYKLTAAVFYKFFISDHLPLLITFTI